MDVEEIMQKLGPGSPVLILGPMNTNKTTILQKIAQKFNAEIKKALPNQRISTLLGSSPAIFIDEAQFLILDALYLDPQKIYCFAGLALDFKGEKCTSTDILSKITNVWKTKKTNKCAVNGCQNTAVFDVRVPNFDLKKVLLKESYSSICGLHFKR